MDKMKIYRFDYMHLLDLFDTSVAENLRGTGFSEPFLAVWVPDPDAVRSLIGFVHAVGQEPGLTVELLLPPTLLSENGKGAIEAATAADARLDWQTTPENVVLTVSARKEPLKEGQGVPDARLRDMTDRGPDGRDFSRSAPKRETSVLPRVWRSYFAHVSAENPARIEDVQQDDWILRQTETCWLAFRCGEKTGIVEARFGVTGDDAVLYGLLSVLCETSIGNPVADIAAHGLLRVIERCKRALPVSSLPGIVVPVSLGPEFDSAADLLALFRETAHDAHPDYDKPPSEAWLSMAEGERHSALATAIERFLGDGSRQPDDIELLDVRNDLSGWPVRVFIRFGQGVQTMDRPDTIRRLERFLKQTVDWKLVVLYETAKDENRIRRL